VTYDRASTLRVKDKEDKKISRGQLEQDGKKRTGGAEVIIQNVSRYNKYSCKQDQVERKHKAYINVSIKNKQRPKVS